MAKDSAKAQASTSERAGAGAPPILHARVATRLTAEEERAAGSDGGYSGFAPKASRRPSQSFTTNSREPQGVSPRPRVNSTPRLANSA